MNNCLAIIPARGGSKRIPRKNIKEFCGQPIIKYSIDAALNAGCFDEVMVSTEDKEIAEVAILSGAKVPFFRSKENSDDFSSTADVILEVLNEYKKQGEVFEYCCCIYPTAPFISSERLVDAFDLLKNSGADSVVPVVKFSCPVQRSLKIEKDYLTMIWPENLKKRSQDLIPAYHDSGQFYWFKTENFFAQKKLLLSKTIPLVLPEMEVQDIDNPEDWVIAELKYEILKQKFNNNNKVFDSFPE